MLQTLSVTIISPRLRTIVNSHSAITQPNCLVILLSSLSFITFFIYSPHLPRHYLHYSTFYFVLSFYFTSVCFRFSPHDESYCLRILFQSRNETCIEGICRYGTQTNGRYEQCNYTLISTSKCGQAFRESTHESKSGRTCTQNTSRKLNSFLWFFIRAISKLYICIPTNCTQYIL